MPKTNDNPKEMENLKRDIRRLLGIAAEENLLIFLGAGASKAAGLPTMKELSGIILKDKRSNTESKDVTQFLSEIISILETESQKGITVEQILEMIYHLEFLTKNRENKISFTILFSLNYQVCLFCKFKYTGKGRGSIKIIIHIFKKSPGYTFYLFRYI